MKASLLNLRAYRDAALVLRAVMVFACLAAQLRDTSAVSIWDGASTPAQPSVTDGVPYTLGVKFQSSVGGQVTGMRFYKGTGNTGTHTGQLWTTGGVLLASVTFSNETASGWQEQLLGIPVAIGSNATYIASYHSPSGYFSLDSGYFSAAGYTNGPLRALSNAQAGGNGVFGAGQNFPTLNGNGANYWVDVVFQQSVGPDTNAPMVLGVSPAAGQGNVNRSSPLIVTFNETVDVVSLTTNTFRLLDATNGLVPATVSPGSVPNIARLSPVSPLAAAASYSATLAGGSGGIRDLAGNPLATNYTWSFTTMSENPYGEGPGGPVLVLTGGANVFNAYYAEILLTEGLNAFSLKNIASLTNSSDLAGFDVVLVGNHGLTASQVGILSNWVVGGGNLIATRPDKKLAGLLGLVDAGGTMENGYMAVNSAAAPGAGITPETLQYHGTADLYALVGASEVATLYTNATQSSVYPAVTLRSVGTNGGSAAAFTYDLASSIVLTRQGNPAWADQDRDGSGVTTSDDLFYGNASFDPQPDWVDLNKVAIPQADEQQRLLVNLILEMNMDRRPLPRFWYFPDGHKAVVVMTGDNHGNNATEGRFNQYIAYSPSNGNLEDWELIRGTSYIYPTTLMSDSAVAGYTAQGFEIALHLNTGCAGYTRESLESFFTTQVAAFASAFPSLPSPQTLRNHCIGWSGYTLLPEVAVEYGIRFEASYYYWPSGWVANRPGLFTGSAMPMRFASAEGNVIDVFQGITQMTDESGQVYPYTIDTLLDRALGEEGCYGAYVANMHTDYNPHPQSDAVLTSCLARGVPVVTALQMLTWLDGRNASSLTNIVWSSSSLSFQVNADGQARGLETMVPVPPGRQVSAVRSNGVSVAYRMEGIKGMSYAILPVSSAGYEVEFVVDTDAPVVVGVSPTNGATGVSVNTSVSVVFSEAMDGETISTNTFRLLDGASNTVPGSVLYDSGTFMAVLTPAGPLAQSETYTARVLGGEGGVKDVVGNALDGDYTLAVTTTDAMNYSLWDNGVTPAQPSVTDGVPITLGVKFQSAVAGQVMGLRFYKGPSNTNTHVGSLWTTGGVLLASATFSNETASGWQEQLLGSPVVIESNVTYVASYYSSSGYFSLDSGYFSGGGYTNGLLRALGTVEAGGNGVFVGGQNFPSASGNGANYWVDVVFAGSVGPDTNAPVVVGVSPANGATGVSLNTSVSVVFSEAMDVGTVTNGTITLSNASGVVPSTVSYNPATHAATLMPVGALELGQTYTARVLGGAVGVKDVAGNALAGDYSWTFSTTVTADYSLWDDTASPAIPSVTDGVPITLGVKFQSAVAGQIMGLRFYKGPNNSAPHVGNLWTTGGVLLASVTFSNETASGWQEQLLGSPVVIESNVTYVASYYSSSGYFSLDNGYFSVGGYTNGPLRALGTVEAGGNGVYVGGRPEAMGCMWEATPIRPTRATPPTTGWMSCFEETLLRRW